MMENLVVLYVTMEGEWWVRRSRGRQAMAWLSPTDRLRLMELTRSGG